MRVPGKCTYDTSLPSLHAQHFCHVIHKSMLVGWVLLVPSVQGWCVWATVALARSLVFMHTVLVAYVLLVSSVRVAG